MLLLSNEDIEKVLSMKTFIDVLETSLSELAAGRAVSRYMQELYDTRHTDNETAEAYVLKTMDGLIPFYSASAIRMNSDLIRWEKQEGTYRKNKIPVAAGQKWVGLIFLFDTTTGAMSGILPDGYIQRMRVGAMGGLSAKYLARKNATNVGLLGSGWQAGAQIMAVSEVINIKQVKVYSPTAENREKFAKDFGKSLAIEIQPAPTAEEAVEGADIVIAATSSLEPVIDAEWVKAGMHLISVRLPEFDSATLKKCTIWTASKIPGGLSVRNISLAIGGTDKIPVREKDRIAPGVEPNTFLELAPLVARKESGRKDDKEITCFMIRGDTGMQFTAIAAKTIELARAHGLGRELPDEWFCQDYHP